MLDNNVPLHRHLLVITTGFKSQDSWLQVTETQLKLVEARKGKTKGFFRSDNSGVLGCNGFKLDSVQELKCHQDTRCISQPHVLSVLASFQVGSP